MFNIEIKKLGCEWKIIDKAKDKNEFNNKWIMIINNNTSKYNQYRCINNEGKLINYYRKERNLINE